MKKHLLKSLLLIAALVMGAGSAWAGDKTVVSYSFDDVNSPAVTAGSRVSLDYTKTSVITSTAFLNAWNSTNGDPGASTISLGSTDLSAETWTLSFEWAAVGGCNSKIDHTTLKAGETTLFDLSGNSNWNTTVTLSVAGAATATTLPVPGCDKSYRFTANTGNQMNTTAYWHHFVITGSSDGVKLTITNSSTGNAIVTDMVLSETNVNPTSLIIEPCCGGAIGIDELSLSYFVEGEVIQTPMAAYTAVNGINRTITATCATEGATLYYSTDGENWTEGASVTVSESGNVYFKAVKGNSESDVLTFAAEAGTEIVLNAPTIARNANGTVTISADQSKLLLAPTATIYYTYGEENGSFTGSKELTVAADATITAYAEAEGYAKSADATRAVALFPEDVDTLFSVAAATKGWSANAFNAETITASERTYATLLLDEAAWSENVLLQTDGAWGLRANGNWYINSNTDNSWLLVKDTKAGNIIVVDATFAPAETVNATYTEKYSFGTKHAYTITADGNAEFALIKPAATEMDYFYGVYGYSVMSDAETESALMTEARDLAADADAVAVGKLLAAIATAKESGDESGLQAAIDQFKADNADTELDLTEKVGKDKESWTVGTGNNSNRGTYPKGDIILVEHYGESDAGVMISQEVSVENGLYNIELYATSHNAWNNYGANLQEDANDVAYVFGQSGENIVKTWITARRNSGMIDSEPELYAVNGIEVTDGKLKMGLALDKAGQTEWHTIQIGSLKKITTAKEVFAADQEELKALIAEANTLLADETKTEGRGLFKGLVAAAELCVDSKMMNITELENVIGNLKDGITDFKKANPVIPNGKYYLVAMDREDNNLMAAGMNWGTQGIINGVGIDLNFALNENADAYTIETNIYNGANHFLGGDLFMDGAKFEWTIEEDAVYGHNISAVFGGVKKYIGVGEDNRLTLTETAYGWAFIKADWWENNVKEEGLAKMATATAENPVDATFLLKDANFNRNDHRWDAWKVEFISGNNKNLGGGCNGTNGNGNAESYHAAFNISQTIANAPAGVYTLTAQGFYRQDDGATEAAPVFYIGDATAEVPTLTGTENGMTDASISFTEGKYTIEPISYTLAEDGALTVGIKNGENVHQWVIFDNFRLTYYGPAPAQPQVAHATVTYALAEGDTFTSGQTVEVKNGEDVVATITYGEAGEGYAAFKAAKADSHIDGFAAFTEGNGTNGNSAGGTFYTIVPKYDGVITVGIVLNAGKAFSVLEDGVAKENFNGLKATEKYYGTTAFNVTANKSYKFFCAGSKLGFYGFNYEYGEGTEAIDETDNGITTGITTMNADAQAQGIYNLRGQKVENMVKGQLYIINGKKVMIK